MEIIQLITRTLEKIDGIKELCHQIKIMNLFNNFNCNVPYHFILSKLD